MDCGRMLLYRNDHNCMFNKVTFLPCRKEKDRHAAENVYYIVCVCVCVHIKTHMLHVQETRKLVTAAERQTVFEINKDIKN